MKTRSAVAWMIPEECRRTGFPLEARTWGSAPVRVLSAMAARFFRAPLAASSSGTTIFSRTRASCHWRLLWSR